MQFKIPFTPFMIQIEKRSVSLINRNTRLPIKFDRWGSNFSLGKSTPILENIYDTIATEFSKIDLFLVRNISNKSNDGRTTSVYPKQTDNPNYSVLNLRPNLLQTKSELLYTIAYQLCKYGNSLVRIVRDTNTDRNVVLALEPINVNDYLFGQGYDINGGLYLKLKEKQTNKIVLLDYNDTIHLRLNPYNMFFGDEYHGAFELGNFIRLFDENLNSMLQELKNAGTINGIVELGASIVSGGFNSTLVNKSDKLTRQQEVIERIKATEGGVLVLDAGEKWTSLSRDFKTMSSEQVDSIMKYLYTFKGINQSVINGTASEAEMEVFYNKTIMPIIERFLEEVNYKFLTQTARTQGQVVEYFKNPFEYMATKDLLDNLYKGAMFFTQNEIRHMAFKMGPIAGGDILIDNKNFEKAEVGNGEKNT